MLKVYIKPLKRDVAKRLFDRFLDRRFKYAVARAGLKTMKEMQKKAMGKSGARIRKGMSYTIGKNSISFYLSSIGGYHNYGVRRHKMKYLAKGLKKGQKKIIPIQEKGQPVRFRTLTLKSMKRKNAWTHPGFKGKGFFEDGIQQMKKDMRHRLATSISRYVSK